MDSPADPSPEKLLRAIERFYAAFDQNHLSNPKLGHVFEDILQKFYESVIEPGDHVVDLGAHNGLHTMPMSVLVKPGGMVHAFEPLPVKFAELERTVTENGMEEWITLSQVAVSNYRGEAEFVFVEANHGFSGLREKKYPFDPEKKLIKVQVDTLDRCVDASERVTFIKIDVEGGEFHALQGGVELLRAQRPIVVFENSKGEAATHYEYTPEEFFRFFEELDYELRDILGCRVVPEHWAHIGPWYTVAYPREASARVVDLLMVAAVECLLEATS